MVSAEPVPQRLQLMDMFMNTVRSQCALCNALSTASPKCLCGMGTVPGPAVLHAAQTSQTPNAPQAFHVAVGNLPNKYHSCPGTGLFHSLYVFEVPGWYEFFILISPVWYRRWLSHFFPHFQERKSLDKTVLYFEFLQNGLANTVARYIMPRPPYTSALHAGSGERCTQGPQPWMSPSQQATRSVTLVIQKPEGKNIWLASSSAWI